MALSITLPILPLANVGWERPLPAAWWIAQDSAVLAYALTLLRTTLAEAVVTTPTSDAQRVQWVEQAGRQHRLIINQAHLLRTLPHLYFVGFFGQRRRGLTTAPLLDLVVALDDALVAELREHPDIVGYCTCELAGGDYGNLVLLRTEAAKAEWAKSERHSYVARTLAPHYYRSVRLHHGSIPGGLAAGHDPVIEHTHYYDYEKKYQNNEQEDGLGIVGNADLVGRDLAGQYLALY
ncbi:MAG: hypothetical protein DYG89_36470 [Caldilinea sp. CFX5]|nr:hypothetical protein [Caldilinea sp. CFX5]